jgi:hypothetical protein
MKVYLIESVGMAAGRIFAIFYSREDAKMHQKTIDEDTIIVERTCFTGQANNPGYNR